MKTTKTIELENKLYQSTQKLGVFGCFEVTIGWFGKERVDYMTYDTKGIWRCYEIKVSKTDFHSKAHNTFVGNFNYYVMPKELYEEVKEEIPSHIGIHCGDYCIKNAKKQELGVNVEVLKDSFIRSLSREVDKQIKSRNNTLIERYRRAIKSKEAEIARYRELYYCTLNKLGG